MIEHSSVHRGMGAALLGAFLLAAAGPAAADGIKYSVPAGVRLTAVAMEMKKDGDEELCFVTVSVKNETGQDRPFEIELGADDGFAVTTYTGGPKKSPLKNGAAEKAEFKTLLTKLPTELAVWVRPYSE